MADQVKLLLDEDTRPLLAATLRERGFDAVHVNQLGLSGWTDVAILREAERQGRALLTHNVADFALIAADWAKRGTPHHGVILAPQRPFRELLARPPGEAPGGRR
ncbi:MAG: hypothetical protein FD180_1208 [Planctomycetota bacterium]|nr:MAG: hypothetical protein FD180_1208 [Planctomycetota bacterium]